MSRKRIFNMVGILILVLILAVAIFVMQKERRVKIIASAGEVIGEAVVIKPKLEIEVAEELLNKPRLYVYDPPLKIKAIYKSIDEAKNKTPEELMISIRSADTQEWLNYNTKGGKAHKADPEKLAKRHAYDPDLYYFELIHKLEFERNDTPIVIIKYWFVDGGKRTLIAEAWLEKINGRWVRGAATYNETENLAELVRIVKTEYLQDIITGRRSKNDLVNELARKSRRRGVFDMDLLSKEFDLLLSTEEGIQKLIEICDRPEQ